MADTKNFLHYATVSSKWQIRWQLLVIQAAEAAADRERYTLRLTKYLMYRSGKRVPYIHQSPYTIYTPYIHMYVCSGVYNHIV